MSCFVFCQLGRGFVSELCEDAQLLYIYLDRVETEMMKRKCEIDASLCS